MKDVACRMCWCFNRAFASRCSAEGLWICVSVRVSKEVSADSREAKTYLKTQKAEEEDAGNPDKPLVSESPLPGAR